MLVSNSAENGLGIGIPIENATNTCVAEGFSLKTGRIRSERSVPKSPINKLIVSEVYFRATSLTIRFGGKIVEPDPNLRSKIVLLFN